MDQNNIIDKIKQEISEENIKNFLSTKKNINTEEIEDGSESSSNSTSSINSVSDIQSSQTELPIIQNSGVDTTLPQELPSTSRAISKHQEICSLLKELVGIHSENSEIMRQTLGTERERDEIEQIVRAQLGHSIDIFSGKLKSLNNSSIISGAALKRKQTDDFENCRVTSKFLRTMLHQGVRKYMGQPRDDEEDDDDSFDSDTDDSSEELDD